MLSAWPVTVTVVVVAVRVAVMLESASTLGAELVEDALGFGLAGSGGLALETADRDALLGDGLGDVLGVLPQGELDHPHDQQQQEGGGDDQLGGDRAALDRAQTRNASDRHGGASVRAVDRRGSRGRWY